jgi:hypothetical protein
MLNPSESRKTQMGTSLPGQGPTVAWPGMPGCSHSGWCRLWPSPQTCSQTLSALQLLFWGGVGLGDGGGGYLGREPERGEPCWFRAAGAGFQPIPIPADPLPDSRLILRRFSADSVPVSGGELSAPISCWLCAGCPLIPRRFPADSVPVSVSLSFYLAGSLLLWWGQVRSSISEISARCFCLFKRIKLPSKPKNLLPGLCQSVCTVHWYCQSLQTRRYLRYRTVISDIHSHEVMDSHWRFYFISSFMNNNNNYYNNNNNNNKYKYK